jgi:hypothetical protein
VNQLLLQFSYLQMLDLLTTMVFMLHGIHEANPVVRFALRYSSHPLSGLLAVKVLALGLGIYCWRCGRERLLTRINILFAIVVAWNLLALIMGAYRSGLTGG